MIGQTISHYRIVEKLGEGGMGVVYKAQDIQLRRTVALKFLSPEVVDNEEVKARLIREAQASAALDHPHICHVYGVHEENNRTFIAMAYVDGPTLADKIKERPLPLEQALDIAIQIAEGLQEAHEFGVVHRDIKPHNVMLTAKGRVKIMDFGLASLAGRSRITKSGTTLGTPAYMPPEQLEGRDVDQRADIWSLTCVLYEMLTQRTPFEAEYEQAVAYRILNEQPEPVTALRSNLPIEIDRIVCKGLAKDPGQRYQHADELVVDLRALTAASGARSAAVSSAHHGPASRVAWYKVAPLAIASLACLFAGALVWHSAREPTVSGKRTVRRFSYQPPRRLSSGPSSFQRPNIAISPDGTRLAYVGVEDGVEQLILRDLRERDELRPLRDTTGAHSPFFSPDGEHLGFFADGKIKRLDIDTGAAREVAKVLPVSNGGTWASTDEIYFVMWPRGGIKRVSASGGEIVDITVPRYESGDQGHLNPHALPGGEALLFTQWPDEGVGGLRVQALSVQSGEVKTLLDAGTSPRYTADGHLIYAHEGKLFAVRFDPNELIATGRPTVIAEGVDTVVSAEYDVSNEGTLVYRRAGAWLPARKLVEVDRNGEVLLLDEHRGVFMDLAVSADGTHLATAKVSGSALDVWAKSLPPNESPLTRITFRSHLSFCPVWTPDNIRVAYTQALPGKHPELYWKAADGSGEPELLFEMPHAQFPSSFSSDGRLLAFNHEDPASDFDVYVLDLAAREARPFRNTEFNEGMAKFHPSGEWIAYHSDRSGRYEVYLAEYPAGSERQVSVSGGTNPIWTPDGRELVYREGDRLWLTAVSVKPSLQISTPELLLERPQQSRGNYADSYGISARGNAVLIDLDPEESKPSEISIVLNWQSGLNVEP